MARNTPHVPKSVTIYSITIPPWQSRGNHGAIKEQRNFSSGRIDVMAINDLTTFYDLDKVYLRYL